MISRQYFSVGAFYMAKHFMQGNLPFQKGICAAAGAFIENQTADGPRAYRSRVFCCQYGNTKLEDNVVKMYNRQTRGVVSRQYITNTRQQFATYLSYSFFTHRTFHRQTFLHTETFTHRRFYTKKLVHTDVFTHRRLYTQTLLQSFTHTCIYTDAFTHSSFYTKKLVHTETFTHRHFYTDALTHRRFDTHTQTLLHTEVFTHRRFYTQKLLHTDACIHRHFYTQTRLHTNTFTRRDRTRGITILPPVLAIEPHFVRKCSLDNLQIAILPQFLASENVISCERVATGTRKSQFYHSFYPIDQVGLFSA